MVGVQMEEYDRLRYRQRKYRDKVKKEGGVYLEKRFLEDF